MVRPASGGGRRPTEIQQGFDVGREHLVRLFEQIEPEGAEFGQHPAFVGNAAGEHPVEGADPVGADQQQLAA